MSEDARIIDAIKRVSCEALDRFCKNEVNLFLLTLMDHSQKFCAFFRGRAGDAFIRKNPSHRGGTHKTVLEMFSGNGVACGLCRFSILQVIQ